MDILIISEFGEDYSKTDNDRFLYLAKLLTDADADDQCVKPEVEIITSSFRHTKKSHRREPEYNWPFKITFIEEPGYPKNICLKRFYSHYCWGRNVLKYLKTRKKPDVIYCAVPSLSGPNLVAKYCKKNNVRFIIDVQDLWPEAFKMVFKVPLLKNIVFAPFTLLANGIYKRADYICAVSETYCKRALKVNENCASKSVFLGTDLSTFDRFASEDSILKKNPGEVWLAYCGTLGASYDLVCVIDAIKAVKDNRIRFIVMGDGPKMDDFKQYAETSGINSCFTGRLPYNQMCSLLKVCDITVNPIAHLAAQSIINKHADYAACGLPVINTQESEEYRNLVESYNMGFNCSNNDSNDLAEKLKTLINNDELRKEMGKNSRRCAEEKFDRKATYQSLKGIINGDCSDGII